MTHLQHIGKALTHSAYGDQLSFPYYFSLLNGIKLVKLYSDGIKSLLIKSIHFSFSSESKEEAKEGKRQQTAVKPRQTKTSNVWYAQYTNKTLC